MKDLTIFENMNFTQSFKHTQFDIDTTQRQKVFKGLMNQLVVAISAPTLQLFGCVFPGSGKQWECLSGPGGKVEFMWDLFAAIGSETGRGSQKS